MPVNLLVWIEMVLSAFSEMRVLILIFCHWMKYHSTFATLNANVIIHRLA